MARNTAERHSKAKGERRGAGAADGWAAAPAWQKVLRLARPKFLVYSLACHMVGVAYGAAEQEMAVDWPLFWMLQATVWLTHVMTHYWNEHADVEVDKMNRNASSWTGGSKVLASGWLPTWVAAVCGCVTFALSFAAGVMTVWRFLLLRPELLPERFSADSGLMSLFSLTPDDFVTLVTSDHFPLQFVIVGFSVLFVALAYSLPPLHLSANSLGELAVSYVLTFCTPAVGLLIQGGVVDLAFVQSMVPFFIISSVRMMIMNIPDREGDRLGGKVTSIVLIGEEKAIIMHNVLTVVTYAMVLPQVPMPSALRIAYCIPLPFRWWQSLRINVPQWWAKRNALSDSIPFVESLYVLATASAMCFGLLFLMPNTIIDSPLVL